MDLRIVFLLFLIYSFLGWIVDICGKYLETKKIGPRGFLIGPYCPIYGVGALLMIFFLYKYSNDIFALFILACVLGSSLEYFTSYIMEKIFKTRWWDYSANKYNLNGRICLFATTCFGILGVIVVKFVNPFLFNSLILFPDLILTFGSIILLTLFIIDAVISFNIVCNIKRVDLSNVVDSTEEITKRVKDVLRNSSIWNKRLVLAFPNFIVKFPKTSMEKIKSNLKNFNKSE